MSIGKKAAAEFLGTFWLVLAGCGSAVLAAAFPDVGIGLLGASFAFGLTVLTVAYGIGHISGCHLNPAVSIGLMIGKRSPANELAPYVIAQVLGGITGSDDHPGVHRQARRCVDPSRLGYSTGDHVGGYVIAQRCHDPAQVHQQRRPDPRRDL